MGPAEGTKLAFDSYVQLGFAGLVAFLFAVLIFYILWDRRRSEKDFRELLTKTISALERNSQIMENVSKMNEVNTRILDRIVQSLEFLKGRRE